MTKQIPNDLFFAQVEEEIACGREVRIRLVGTSMRPWLKGGVDELVVAPCQPDTLQLLDVVLFRYHGHHVLHRIVHISTDGYTLQGDGVWASQEHCTEADIVGRVSCICRPSCRPLPVTAFSWRFRSRVWHLLRPFRRWLLRICRILGY